MLFFVCFLASEPTQSTEWREALLKLFFEGISADGFFFFTEYMRQDNFASDALA